MAVSAFLLFVLMNALMGQGFRIRLKRKLMSEPSLLSLSSPTDKDITYNENSKDMSLRLQLRKDNGIVGLGKILERKTKNSNLNWLTRPTKNKLQVQMDEDVDKYIQERDDSKQRTLKYSRTIPVEKKTSSFIENYRKYKDSYFKQKNANEDTEQKGRMYKNADKTKKLHGDVTFAGKDGTIDLNRPNRMLIGPIRQKDHYNKTRLKQNRKFKPKSKNLMKRFGRAVSVAVMIFTIVSLMSLIATTLLYFCTKLYRKRIRKQKTDKKPQPPKSVFIAVPNSPMHGAGEEPKFESNIHVNSKEELNLKKSISLLQDKPRENDIEETTPLLILESKPEQDRYDSSSSTETETIKMIKVTKTSTNEEGSDNEETKYSMESYTSRLSQKKEKPEKTVKFPRNQNLIDLNKNEDEKFTLDFLRSSGTPSKEANIPGTLSKINTDKTALNQAKTEKIKNCNKEDKPEKRPISKLSISNQSYDLYAVRRIEHANVPSTSLVQKKISKQVTHLGDSNEYKKLSVDRNLNVTENRQANVLSLGESNGEEVEKSRVELCSILDIANKKLVKKEKNFAKKKTDSRSKSKDPIPRNIQSKEYQQLRRENTEITLEAIDNSVPPKDKFVHLSTDESSE
ncbi:uncharacterized protein [Centruroides vittatus]|uniref:uncharacterized protein n=1 Tax=Centruroides vittatus TaxID=120091 RepID=UPI003510280B